MTTYHTDKDRRAEVTVLERLSASWQGTTLEQNPDPFDCFDAYGYRENRVVRALVEIKVRSFIWGQFPSVVLAFEKVRRLVAVARFFDAKPIFVVLSADLGVRWADLRPGVDLSTRTGGRTQSVRRAQDYEELVVDLPLRWFTEVR